MKQQIPNILSDKSANSLNWNIRDELKGKELDEIRRSQPRLPYSIGLINLDGSLNIGTIIRTAVIYGASSIHIFGKKKYDKRSTVGAHNYIDIHFHKMPETILEISNLLDEYKFDPVFVEQGGMSIDTGYLEAFVPGKTETAPCFIFGSESDGIPFDLYEYPFVVEIPQYGVLRSLNVSAAASILMYKFVEVLEMTK